MDVRSTGRLVGIGRLVTMRSLRQDPLRSVATGNGPARRLLLGAAATAIALAACSSGTDSSDGLQTNRTDAPTTAPIFSSTDPDTSVTTTPSPTAASTSTSSTSTPTTSTPTTSTSTTTTTSTLPAGTVAASIELTADAVVLGTSVEGREITAERYGTPGGRRVLVIGVIHGDEDAGIPIVDDLRRRALADELDPDVELWLVPSMNPDGQFAQVRQNSNQVDLNRNFPLRWGPIGVPGDGQYAGTGPASEPETQAMVSFMEQLRPDLTLWYHQDANLIIPSSGRDGRIRARYAELSGLPVEDCCAGGVYTGVAATWARDLLADQQGAAFIVELPGGDLPTDQVTRHADTVATIVSELATI